MLGTKNISSNKGRKASFACLCAFFVVVIFLFSQMLSTAHAHEHEHEHEEPLHQSCEFCILAGYEDSDFGTALDQSSDGEETTSFWVRINRLALPDPKPTPTIEYVEQLIDPPPDLNLRADCARAPPIYI